MCSGPRSVAGWWRDCDREVAEQRYLAVRASDMRVVAPEAGVTACQLQRGVAARGCSAACSGGPGKSSAQDPAVVDAESGVDGVCFEYLLPVAAVVAEHQDMAAVGVAVGEQGLSSMAVRRSPSQTSMSKWTLRRGRGSRRMRASGYVS